MSECVCMDMYMLHLINLSAVTGPMVQGLNWNTGSYRDGQEIICFCGTMQ
jgi:hypothetical protein